MTNVAARAAFCLAMFIILFVGFFSVVTHDPRTLTAFNHFGARNGR